MRRLLIVSIVGTCLVTAALACIGGREASVADVDRAMAQANLSDSDLAKVKVLREQVLTLSARGDGDGALAAEAQAMTIMGQELTRVQLGCARWVRKTT
jgi:hypothetical protein